MAEVRRSNATARSSYSDVHTVRETILRHLGRRVGKTIGQIRQDVENDFGSLSPVAINAERALYRHLDFLMRAGCIRRIRDEDAMWDVEDNARNFHQFLYFFVHDRIPPPAKPYCRICGVVGARTDSHAAGHITLMRRREPLQYVSVHPDSGDQSVGPPASLTDGQPSCLAEAENETRS
jgi:hypothetical protein